MKEKKIDGVLWDATQQKIVSDTLIEALAHFHENLGSYEGIKTGGASALASVQDSTLQLMDYVFPLGFTYVANVGQQNGIVE